MNARQWFAASSIAAVLAISKIAVADPITLACPAASEGIPLYTICTESHTCGYPTANPLFNMSFPPSFATKFALSPPAFAESTLGFIAQNVWTCNYTVKGGMTYISLTPISTLTVAPYYPADTTSHWNKPSAAQHGCNSTSPSDCQIVVE